MGARCSHGCVSGAGGAVAAGTSGPAEVEEVQVDGQVQRSQFRRSTVFSKLTSGGSSSSSASSLPTLELGNPHPNKSRSMPALSPLKEAAQVEDPSEKQSSIGRPGPCPAPVPSPNSTDAMRMSETASNTPAFVNVLMEHTWPCISDFTTDVLGRVIEPAIKTALGNMGSKFGFNLKECHLGSTPAQFTEIQTHRSHQYMHEKRLDNLVLKGKLQWEGNISIMTRFGSLPVGIKRVNLSGNLVMECVGMMPRPPFFQGLRVFFVNQPKVELEFQGALTSVLELKTIKRQVMAVVERQISASIVVPNRMGIPFDKEVEIFGITRPPPKGILTLRVVRAEGLLAMDHSWMTKDRSSDPYVVIRCGSERFKSETVNHTLSPDFDFEVRIPIVTVRHQRIHIELWDADFGKEDDFLGAIELGAEEVVNECRNEGGAAWLDLANEAGAVGERGRVLISAAWRPLTIGPQGADSDGLGLVCAGIYSASQLPGQAEGTRFWVVGACTGLAPGRSPDPAPSTQLPDGRMRTSQLTRKAQENPASPEVQAERARLERKLHILRKRGLTAKEIAQVLEVDESSVKRQATGLLKTKDLQAMQRHTIVWNSGFEFLALAATKAVLTFELRSQGTGYGAEEKSLGKCSYAVAGLLEQDGLVSVETLTIPDSDITLKLRLELRFLASASNGACMTSSVGLS